MSFADFQDRISRSIKVVGLPAGYEPEDILANLRNAGTIEDVKLGLNELIVTYSNSNEKDLSKMYDGCPVGDINLKLEDPEDFEINTGEKKAEPEKVEEKHHHEPEPVVQHQEEQQNQYSQYAEKYREPEHHEEAKKVEEPVHHREPEPDHHREPEPVHHREPEPVHHREPEPVHHEEPVHHKEPEPVHHVEPEHKEEPKHVEKVEPTPVPVPVVEKREVQPERKPEVVHTEKKVEPVAVATERPRVSEVPAAHHEARGGDSAKELLRELQNTNLPARAGLPAGDTWNAVTGKSYLLIFTMVWGLQLFLRSVF